MNKVAPAYRPMLTQAGLSPTHPVTVLDEYGTPREVSVAGESLLTLYVDEREIVTLMTRGTPPEALPLGYLRTQRFVEQLEEIRSVEVSRETESVHIHTHRGVVYTLSDQVVFDDPPGQRATALGSAAPHGRQAD